MIENEPRPEWSALPREGTKGVEGRVLLDRDGLLIANLRFSQNATIDKHPAKFEVDVICLSGAGFTSIGDETSTIRAGQTVRWPRDVDHCLWTENSEMETIMVERYAGS